MRERGRKTGVNTGIRHPRIARAKGRMHRLDPRPLSEREFVYTQVEACKLLGTEFWTFLHYRRSCPGFPILPTTKAAILKWAQKYGVYGQRGGEWPISPTRKRVVELREHGWTTTAIARELGIAPKNVVAQWQRHLRSIARAAARWKNFM